jgi:8-oxo-dGTP pyrophosphatase MutT (NUDIX family)
MKQFPRPGINSVSYRPPLPRVKELPVLQADSSGCPLPIAAITDEHAGCEDATPGDLPGGKADLGEDIDKALIREIAEETGLAASLANQADLLAQNMGRPRDALPLAKEAYQLATEYELAKRA